MKRFLYILPLLAACANPQETCRQQAVEEVRILEQLIEETEGNIERGYALESEVVNAVDLQVCLGNIQNLLFCNRTGTTAVETPVAIDIRSERQKLKTLQERLQEAQQRAAYELQQCEAKFDA